MSLLSKARLPVLLLAASFLCGNYLYFFLLVEGTWVLEYELFNLSSTSFSFSLILDKVSLSFGAVVTLISACVFTFACKYMEEDIYFYRFIWILMAFVISMNLLTFSGSLFFLLLGWDGLGITSFALIVYYQSFESLSAGFQTLMANRVGDAIIVAGSFFFICFGQYTFTSLTKAMWLLIFVLCLAALTKSAQYPFSSWLPAAMAAPTPVSALVHSSTLVTAGIFLVIRLSYNLPLTELSSTLLLICGAVTCLLGGWAATFENDIKKIIALSTLSQLGVMVFSLGLGFPGLALFHLYTHALFKALLFLAAGAILLTSFGAQDIRLLGGVGLKMPLAMVLFNISSLCLIGAPFLSAFYSKHLILEKMFLSGLNLIAGILMLFATAMTAKYVSRTLKAVVWGKVVMPAVSPPLSLAVSGPMITLGIGAIAGGKLLATIDISNMELAFLPGFYGSLINGVTLLGLILGLLLHGERSSHALSSLFFLTPVFSLSSKVLAPLVRKLGVVDYGWAEPLFLMKKVLGPSGASLSETLAWPNYEGALLRAGIGLLVLFYGFTFIL
uniref:NADH-ubiquinone oxidoreductase chain 5 n=1 Tax=Auriculastra duplicata TaxID=1628032 RepID=A0A343SWG4_9EUPU|nr:NADH dehydrogenase subunit 5 [Auriculastra duplicata]AUT77314.1 NADH dehydrogenase subunit 5 [Auriculastra duplicata]